MEPPFSRNRTPFFLTQTKQTIFLYYFKYQSLSFVPLDSAQEANLGNVLSTDSPSVVEKRCASDKWIAKG